MTDVGGMVAWVDQGGEAYVPEAAIAISLHDTGFRQGVVAVERLRTYGGKPAELAQHLARWRRTLEHLLIRIPTDQSRVAARIEALIERNRAWCQRAGDFGITMLATPGRFDDPGGGPTQIMHLNPLDFETIRRRRSNGQPLVITDVQQPSPRCWPRDIKVRCRLHYYSADAAARLLMPDGLGVLIDADGSITETSVANIAIVRDGICLAPPIDQVLPGVTQNRIRRLADRLGLPWQHRPLFPADLRDADEVWLMGTDGGLWFADRVDGHPIGDGTAGPHYRQMSDAFDRQMRGPAGLPQ
ncbi:MAG: branched-chain amino acid aminotransferase [Planctomycetaceae bacterium]|nr:MAG: branched-chain amino acid aminotransferase [Planctomycetaceae bacterium]